MLKEFTLNIIALIMSVFNKLFKKQKFIIEKANVN